MAKRIGDADRDTQEGPLFPGTPDQRRQDLATRVVEQERVAAVLPYEGQWTSRPRGVQNAPELVDVLEARDGPRLLAEATPHQEARASVTVDAEDDPPVVFPLRFEP
jgi:hypothetical protein